MKGIKTIRNTILLMFVLNTLISLKVSAQGIGGFFHQQSTKEKLMLIQIAGYQTFLKELESGYRITQQGLNTAHVLKNGTFTLHRDYYSSLAQVSPVVANDPRINDIRDMLTAIELAFSNALSWQKEQRVLNTAEIGYMQSVYTGLLDGCDESMNKLRLILAPGAAQMTDEQRLEGIEQVYTDMVFKYRFTRDFTGQSYELSGGLASEQSGRQLLRKFYNLNE